MRPPDPPRCVGLFCSTRDCDAPAIHHGISFDWCDVHAALTSVSIKADWGPNRCQECGDPLEQPALGRRRKRHDRCRWRSSGQRGRDRKYIEHYRPREIGKSTISVSHMAVEDLGPADAFRSSLWLQWRAHNDHGDRPYRRTQTLWPIRVTTTAALRWGRYQSVVIDGVAHRLAHFGMVPGTLCRSEVWRSPSTMPRDRFAENLVAVTCKRCREIQGAGFVDVHQRAKTHFEDVTLLVRGVVLDIPRLHKSDDSGFSLLPKNHDYQKESSDDDNASRVA